MKSRIIVELHYNLLENSSRLLVLLKHQNKKSWKIFGIVLIDGRWIKLSVWKRIGVQTQNSEGASFQHISFTIDFRTELYGNVVVSLDKNQRIECETEISQVKG